MTAIDDSYLKKIGITVTDLMFAVTLKCNRRCAHCYVGNEWLDTGISFTYEDAVQILDWSGSAGLSRLSILGGEPVLHEKISELILKAQKYEIEEKRLVTNGVTLGFFDITKIRPHHLNHIAMSFEGYTADIHNTIRGAGTFNAAMKTLVTLLQDGFDIKITYTVTGFNLSTVRQALKLFHDLGIREVNISSVGMIGNATRHPELAVSPRDWVEFYKDMHNLSGLAGMKLRIPPRFYTAGVQGEPKKFYDDLIQGAYTPFRDGSRLVIYPNGRVYVFSDLTCRYYHVCMYKQGDFCATPDNTQLLKWQREIHHPSPATKLQEMASEGYIPLPASYKVFIQY